MSPGRTRSATFGAPEGRATVSAAIRHPEAGGVDGVSSPDVLGRLWRLLTMDPHRCPLPSSTVRGPPACGCLSLRRTGPPGT